MDVAKPKLVALQLSEADYNSQYLDVVKHPQFREVMNKVDYLIKIKEVDKLNHLPELDINKGIENLFIVNYCKQNGCKVVVCMVMIRLSLPMSHTRVMRTCIKRSCECDPSVYRVG